MSFSGGRFTNTPAEDTAPSSPPTPPGNTDSPLLPSTTQSPPLAAPPTQHQPRLSSPLNPNNTSLSRSRPGSRGSTQINRIASYDSNALNIASQSQRGSMLLYRLASEEDQLHPPANRFSVGSELSFESKYPTSSLRGLVAYLYDPDLDDPSSNANDVDDLLHTIEEQKIGFSWRGIGNVSILALLIAALLCLFIIYPVLTFIHNNARNLAIDGNTRINSSGQAPEFLGVPGLVDLETPANSLSRTGFDGKNYVLVFSDEFNKDGRTFRSGDDPVWEAEDLWDGTPNQAYYDPGQVTTKGGSLVIEVDQEATNGLQFKSGMVHSWNKFCFTGGYVEVSVSLPGPNSNTQGYAPGAYALGNLARPGYAATGDGVWPYSYDSCDVGTFPNQTWANLTGPDAALHTEQGQDATAFELSWLTGQKFSSCTCSGEDHPGPSVGKGRGAPEIDILEAQKNELGPGAKVSQSALFAPFTHDYVYQNSTQDEWKIYKPATTQANSFHGSATEQSVSSLTDLPANIFNGSGGHFATFGFEYFSNPSSRDDGFITWHVNGEPTARMGASAVGADQGVGGSQVGPRLISEEPMALVFNLAISNAFQNVDLTTMTFPAELRIDYVRVYQREDSQNIGCDPNDYPTANYIQKHTDVYTNPKLTSWGTGIGGAGLAYPKNQLFNGGC